MGVTLKTQHPYLLHRGNPCHIQLVAIIHDQSSCPCTFRHSPSCLEVDLLLHEQPNVCISCCTGYTPNMYVHIRKKCFGSQQRIGFVVTPWVSVSYDHSRHAFGMQSHGSIHMFFLHPMPAWKQQERTIELAKSDILGELEDSDSHTALRASMRFNGLQWISLVTLW